MHGSEGEHVNHQHQGGPIDIQAALFVNWCKKTYTSMEEAITMNKKNWNRLGKLATVALIAKLILTSKKRSVK